MKGFVAFVLCGIMLLCLAACGDDAVLSCAVFNTRDVKRITFYAYYGLGKGSDVPDEHLAEIISWLDSFRIDEEAPDMPPPGTGTIQVEIEYEDGSVSKQSMDTTSVNGTVYYIKGDGPPECYEEIISKTSLE